MRCPVVLAEVTVRGSRRLNSGGKVCPLYWVDVAIGMPSYPLQTSSETRPNTVAMGYRASVV